MECIKFTDEKPKETGIYFVKGKKDMKECIYYWHEDEEWEIGDLPTNYFNNEQIYWLKE